MRFLRALASLLLISIFFQFGGAAIARQPDTEIAAPALWKASKLGTGSPIYLFGTFHLLPEHLQWVKGPIAKALHHSTRLVFELTPKDIQGAAAQQYMASKGILPEGQSLKSMLDEPTYAGVIKALSPLGLPEPTINHMRPWFVATLSMVGQVKKMGLEGNNGADHILQGNTYSNGKTLVGLETTAEQVELFAGLDDATQVDLVKQSLNPADMDPKRINAMLAAWKSGDDTALETEMLVELKGYPKLYERLLKDRNQKWLPKLIAFSQQPQTTFVAVGAGHLVGPDGLVALLRANGYTVLKLQPKAHL